MGADWDLWNSGINSNEFNRRRYASLKHYIRNCGSLLCFITFILLLFQSFLIFIVGLCVLTIMSQSQLVGSSGEKGDGAGGRKRLKISVPHFNNKDLIKGYSKTLIGRCMNPPKQNMSYLLVTLPRIWNLEDKVIGTDLGLGKFQFDFDEEEDINSVLKMQPFHFDYWMLSLVRWQPMKCSKYPYEITFWIKVLGVPLQFWEEPTFRSIGDAIGETKAVDLDNGRFQVVVDGFKELIFDTSLDFTGGEYYEGVEIPVTLQYEKLFGYCDTCFSLCHKAEKCPLTMKSSEQKEDKNGKEGRHDDRARSYRGVVLNEHGAQQDKKRETREYYGKGKGKMYEEDGSKGARGPEREQKKYRDSRRDYRGEEEGSRPRNHKKEQNGYSHQEYRARGVGAPRGDKDHRVANTKEVREEGEIGGLERTQQSPQVKDIAGPSSSFLAELKETQEEPAQVFETNFGNHGVDLVMADLENTVSEVEECGLGLELSGRGPNDGSAATNLSPIDGEMEEDVRMVEEVHAVTEDNVGEKAMVTGEVANKQGPRRKAVKPAAGAVASNKLKMAQLVNVKRPTAKAGIRHGDNSKQVEDTGTSNPKHDSAKN